MRQRVASSDGESISMALRTRKYIRIYALFHLVIVAVFISQTPFGLVFPFVNNFTFNYSRRHITTLYVASRLVSTLLHALKVFVKSYLNVQPWAQKKARTARFSFCSYV